MPSTKSPEGASLEDCGIMSKESKHWSSSQFSCKDLQTHLLDFSYFRLRTIEKQGQKRPQEVI